MDENYRPPKLEPPPIRWEGSPWPLIVVYGAHWCKDTVRTRRFLNRHGVPYIILDVDIDPEAASKVEGWNNGLRVLPTLDIEGRIVVEPSDEELASILGIEREVET